jgi:hypothetical protein
MISNLSQGTSLGRRPKFVNSMKVIPVYNIYVTVDELVERKCINGLTFL